MKKKDKELMEELVDDFVEDFMNNVGEMGDGTLYDVLDENQISFCIDLKLFVLSKINEYEERR